MKVITEGVEYELEGVGEPQRVKFLSKNSSGVFQEGTTNEEVVAMLIERLYYLNSKNKSAENATIILQLKSIRSLLKKRISRKLKRINEDHESKVHTDTGK